MERTFVVIRIDRHGNVWGRNVELPQYNEEFLGHAEEMPEASPGNELKMKCEALPNVEEVL